MKNATRLIQCLVMAAGLLMAATGSSLGQIAFRSASSASIAAATPAATLTITKPAGLQAGDVMLASIASDGNTTVPTATGWTRLASAVNGSTRLGVTYYRKATAADAAAASFSFTWTSNVNASGGIVAFSGVDTIDVTGTWNSYNAAATLAATACTSTVSNAMVVFLAAVHGNNSGIGTWSAASVGSLTEAFDRTDNSLTNVGAAYAVRSTAGTTGAGSANLGASSRSQTQLLALKPCVNPTISAQSTATQSVCIGNTFTSMSVTASGPGLTYQWFANSSASTTGGSAVANATGASFVPPATLVGTAYYYCVVTNNCGLSSTTAVSGAVTVHPSPVGSASSNPILCNGGTTTLTVSASGGQSPYSGTGSFTRSAGAYTYTITDNRGCSSTVSGTISQPAVLTASASSSAILCNGGTSTVNVSGTGGTAPYTGTGAFTASAGSFSYLVTDANGCTTSATGTISQPALLVAGSTAGSIACFGGSTSVSVTGNGGTAPYSGTGSFNVTAGSYSYTITDANGCTKSTSLSVSEPQQLSAAASSTDILCNGQSATVTVSATGGTAPYTGSGNFTRTAGAYQFNVTDANGCATVANISITQPASLSAAATASPISCNGGSATVQVNATGGTGPYSGTGDYTAVAGAYSYLVTDANGCTASATGTLIQPTPVSVNVPAGVYVCDNGTTSIAVTASGGTGPYAGTGSFTVTAGPYSYTVTDANGCTGQQSLSVVNVSSPSAPSALSEQNFCQSANPVVANLSVTGTAVQWYSVASEGTALASNTPLFTGTTYYASQTVSGCESPQRTAVNATVQAIVPVPTATVVNNCDQTSTISASNYSGDLLWNTGETTSVISVSAGGTYTLTQTVNGCGSAPASFLAAPLSPPNAPAGTATQSFCSETQPAVSGLTVSGTAVIWYDAATGGNVITSSAALQDGSTYYASQTVNGCESQQRLAVTANVTQNPSAPTGDALQVFCAGVSPTIASLAASGTSVSWYDAATGGNVLTSSQVLTDGSSYYASQAVNGCVSTSRLRVDVNLLPTVPTPAVAAIDNCDNTSVLTATGYAGDLLWSTGATTSFITVSTAGTYTVLQQYNGCSSTAATVVAAPKTRPSAPLGAAAQSFCQSAAAMLSDINVAGTSLQWYDAAVGGQSLTTSTLISDGSTYYATQTVNGCESADLLAVVATIIANPDAPTGTATQEFCSGTNPTVAALQITGASTRWYTASSGGTLVSASTILVNGVSYYATQTVNGCESVQRLAVSALVNPTPVAPSGAVAQAFCITTNPTVTDLTATGDAIQWYDQNTGGTLLTGTTALTSGTTYYSSQTANGCESVDRLSVTVTINTIPTDPAATSSATMCNGVGASIAIVGGGGGTGETVRWYTSACGGTPVGSGNTLSVNPSVTTVYYGRYEAGAPCSYNTSCQEATVVVNPRPQAAITSSALSVCAGASATLTGTITASGAWTITLNNNGGTVTGTGSGTWTRTVTPAVTTTYGIVAVSDTLCNSVSSDLTGTVQVTVVPNVTPAVSIVANTSTTVCDGNPVQFTATPVNGGTTPVYQWRVNGVNAGTNSNTFITVPMSSGEQITCVMTSSTACVTTRTVTSNTMTVTIVQYPTFADAGMDVNMCMGSGINLAANTPTLGTGSWSVSVGPKKANSQFGVLSSPTTTFTPQAAGIYTLVWTISNGTTCPVSSDDVIITVSNPPTTASAGPAQTICASSTATLAGNIPTSGTGAWTVFTGPSTADAQFSNVLANNSTFSPSGGGGSYVLRWTISTPGCTPSTSNLTLTVDALSVGGTINNAQTICTGSAPSAISLINNVGSVVRWQRSTDPNFGTSSDITSTSTSLSSATIGSLTTTTYFRAVVKNGLCAAVNSQPIAITVVTPSAAPVSATATETLLCSGTSTFLSLNGGGGGYNEQVVWYTGGCGTTPAGTGNNISVTPSVSTIYYGRYENGAPCSVSTICRSINIGVSAPPSVAAAGADQAACNSGQFAMNALTPSTGTGSWSLVGGTASISNTGSTSTSVNGIPVGSSATLRWTVANAPCLPTFDDVILANNSLPVAPAVAVSNNCGNTTLSATATGNILWSTGETGPSITVFTAGQYSVTQTDANGCTSSVTTTAASPRLATTSQQAAVACDTYTWNGTAYTASGTYQYSTVNAVGCDSVATLALTINQTPAAPAISVNNDYCAGTALLSFPANGDILWNTGAQSGTIQVSASGAYSVTASSNGCTSSPSTVNVTIPSLISASLSASSTAVACNGGTVAVTVTGSGGTAPYTGIGTFNVTAGNYIYLVTDANGCTAQTSINVTEPSLLTATASAPSILCNGGSVNVTVQGSGGAAPYSGTGTYSVTAGNYSYTVTDANGCSTQAAILVSEPAQLTASATAPSILCFGGNVDVTVSGNGGTAPYTGAGVFNITTGFYTYTVTDANGCSAQTWIYAPQPEPLAASSSAPAILCNGGTVNVSVRGNGGTWPYSGTGNFPVTAGTYSYTVTDVNGCTAQTSITITQPTLLTATATAPTVLCNGGNANVIVSGNGGTLPYNGIGTFSVTAGDYTYTVTDANGCTTQASVSVSEPTLLTASATASSILCNGGNVSVTVNGNGGVAPYSGIGTFPVSAGNYTYTVTDANGCTTQASILVSEPTLLTATATAPSILCNGGAVDVTVAGNGGTPPYSGSGTFNVTAGNYTYVVTDAYGCSTQASILVSEPALLTATATAPAVLCNGGNVNVTVSGNGGTLPYTGAGTFSVNAGNYNYTVTDANGCSTQASVSISEPTLLTASATSSSVLCNGGNVSVTVTGQGGVAPYTGTGTFQVAAGNYLYTVTDANGCSTQASVSVSQPTVLTASANAPAILCNGGNVDVTVSGNGGVAPYTGTGTFQVTAGNYVYTVTDANGCSTQASILVSEPTRLTATANASAVNCNGGNVNVTVAGNGGVAPYSGTGTFQVTAGNYSYTVTDANGCSTQASILVSEPSLLTASATAPSILCNGDNVNVTVSGNGGVAPYTGTGTFQVTAGNYNYTVTDANGCSTQASILVTQPEVLSATGTFAAIACNSGTTTIQVTATGGTGPYSGTGNFQVTQGAYTYPVTDANGCTTQAVVVVTEPDQLVVTSTAQNVSCTGGQTNIGVTATGGTPPYSGLGSYSVAAGNYSYTITDANGCVAQTTVTVSEPPLMVAQAISPGISCNGGTATVTVTATGGVAPYTGTGTYTVGPGVYSYTVTDVNGCQAVVSASIVEPTLLVASNSIAPILCNGGASSVTVSATGGTAPYTGTGTYQLTSGAYSYTVTDFRGCTSQTSIVISQPSALIASATAPAILCNGGTADVSVSGSGGTAPYTGTGTFSVTAGNYNYTVTDANGCTTQAGVTVSQPMLLTAAASTTAILCNGGSATVTVSGNGGTTPYTGIGTYNVAAGNYSYTVTDANGCSTQAVVTVSQPSLLTATATAPSILCNGGTADVTVSGNGGTAPYTGTGIFSVTAGNHLYTITDANGCTSQAGILVSQPSLLTATATATAILCNGGSATVTVTGSGGTAPYSGTGTFTATAGNNSYTVTDANGCSMQASITVSQPALLTASATSTAILCNGGSADVTVSGNGGTAPYTGTGTYNVTAGNYSYTVTDANGCSTQAGITVSQPSLLTASSTAPSILCNGGTADVTVSGNGGTSPYTGTGTFPVRAGNYNYTITDANGCSTQASVTLVEPALLTASAASNAILCNGGTATVTVTGSGGTAPYSGTGTFTATAGNNSYTVTDANGCTAQASVTVNQPNLLSASATSTAILCNGGSANVTVSGSGGTAPYAGTGTYNVTAGNYSYTVTDANGCTTQASVSVSQPALLTASATSTAILCNGGSATVTVSGNGGTSPYTGTGSFPVRAGNYNYTITDANGCSTQASVAVNEPSLLTASAAAPAILCNGGSATMTVTGNGGTAPYTGTGTFPVTAGNYNYTVTDANGCSAQASVAVTEPSRLMATATAPPVQCTGGTVNVTVAATGGTAPYTGTGTFPATTGIQTYTVTDANGCTTQATISVVQTEALAVVATASAISCNGGSTTVTVAGTGGTPPYSGAGTFTVTAGTYTYVLTDVNGCASQTSITVTDPALLTAAATAPAILCNGGSVNVSVTGAGGTAPYSGTGTFQVNAGSYSYTVTDANGCSAAASVVLTQPAPLTSSASYSQPIRCFGGQTTVTVTGAGGTAPYTGTGVFSVSAGQQVFTVTDANGCTSTTSVTISQPTAVAATATSTAILCNGGTADVTVSANGGMGPYTGTGIYTVTVGSYTYTVTDANGCSTTAAVTVAQPALIRPSTSFAPIACNGGTTDITVRANGGTRPYTGVGVFTVTAGSYQYTVTDANGCTSTVGAAVTEPTMINVSVASTAIRCFGGTSTVTVSANGGTGPYTGTGSFTTTAGTRSYTVTDANGCTAVSTVVISQPNQLAASATSTAILCNGGSATVTVAATGGTAPYTGTGTFTATAGTRTYSVTDQNGCSGTTSITITQPTVMSVTSAATPIACFGGTSQVTVTASGGTGPYTGAGTYTVTAGSYSYLVTDANGCTRTTSVTVSQPAAIAATATATPIACNGGMATVTVSATGGTAPYTGTGTFQVRQGTYNYQVVDSRGCSTTATITVTQPNQLSAAATATPIACYGGTAQVTVTASGGTAPYNGIGSFNVLAGTYTYNVTDASGCTSAVTVSAVQPTRLTSSATSTAVSCYGGTSRVTVSAGGGTTPYTGTGVFTTTAGAHTYSVTDANGCQSTVNINITQPSQLNAYANAGSINCNGGTTAVNVTAAGGTGPYLGTGTFTSGAGLQSYQVTDANGCVATVYAEITEPSRLIVTATAPPILCNGGSTTVDVQAVGGTAPYNGTGSRTVVAGNYSYAVVDNNGCIGSVNIAVQQPAAITATVMVSNATCSTPGTATAIASGGTGSFTYQWSNGAVTSSISGLAAGTYSVVVIDQNGCARSASGNVSQITNYPQAAGPVNGQTNVRLSTLFTYSVMPVSGATSYRWTLPPNCAGSSNGSSITVTFLTGFISGTICVTPVNACGDGLASCITVSVPTIARPGGGGKTKENIHLPVGVGLGRAEENPAQPEVETDPQHGQDQKSVSLPIRHLVAYPNPTTGKVIIGFSGMKDVVYRLNVRDLTGSIIRTSELIGDTDMSSAVYDFSALPKGIYIVDVQSADGMSRSTIRLVVQ